MARRKQTQPTHIYWLLDMRPETIAAGWTRGKPFYCGKTIHTFGVRLSAHRHKAITHPLRPISKKIDECGKYVRAVLVETVPVTEDWREREKHWINLIRWSFPDSANVCDGGEGVPGNVHTEATLAKLRFAKRNVSAETRAKIGASSKGRTKSPQVREKLRIANLNRSFSAEKKAAISAKISAALTGKKRSPEICVRMSEARKGKKLSAETCAKISAGQKNKIISPEQRAKISATLRGRKRPPHVIEAMRAANTGRVPTAEHRAKLRAANLGKTLSAKHRAKISAAHFAHHAQKHASIHA